MKANDQIMSKNSYLDRILIAFDQGLRALYVSPTSARTCPLTVRKLNTKPLSPQDKTTSGAFMRVNHVGEVCAQALYSAQALSSQSPRLRGFFERARKEEIDHLAWTRQRLYELGDRPSLLNPLWYAGAFSLGMAAGCFGDEVSLGFVMETENQVESHLRNHLERLPSSDLQSQAIVAQMAHDEAEHGYEAAQLGGAELPLPIKGLMKAAAKFMTTVAHHV